MSEVWFLYLIRVRSGDLYTGITLDLERRLHEHREGGPRGAKYLRGRGPLELVFSEPVGQRSRALKAEHAIKRLSRTDKERLIDGTLGLLQILEP